MQSRIFLIYAQPYDPITGGIIVLHKLCHILNSLGHKAFMFPHLGQLPVDLPLRNQLSIGLQNLVDPLKPLDVNPTFQTPVLSFENLETIEQNDSFIAVYPEVIWGNPLNAKNVVRWFLHNPGFHTGKVYYQVGELYFRFGIETIPAQIPGSTVSDSFLTVTHCPTNVYNLDNASKARSGTAYCIRKGNHKPRIPETDGAILIDNLPHEEVAAIFKQVERFISYDSRTYYSQLAVLCGCDSIIVPDAGVSEENWMPDARKRYGLAYGFENLAKAKETAHLVLESVLEDERNSVRSVENFVSECAQFFDRSP